MIVVGEPGLVGPRQHRDLLVADTLRRAGEAVRRDVQMELDGHVVDLRLHAVTYRFLDPFLGDSASWSG